jgi:hypothetical protein
VGYRWLVTVVLVAHFAFLGYVALGGLLVRRWPRAALPHLLAVGWALVVVTVPVNCPLTAAENWARRRAGMTAEPGGFIDRYVENVLYPQRYTVVLWVLVALVVIGSYVGAGRRARQRARAERALAQRAGSQRAGSQRAGSQRAGLSGPG